MTFPWKIENDSWISYACHGLYMAHYVHLMVHTTIHEESYLSNLSQFWDIKPGWCINSVLLTHIILFPENIRKTSFGWNIRSSSFDHLFFCTFIDFFSNLKIKYIFEKDKHRLLNITIPICVCTAFKTKHYRIAGNLLSKTILPKNHMTIRRLYSSSMYVWY